MRFKIVLCVILAAASLVLAQTPSAPATSVVSPFIIIVDTLSLLLLLLTTFFGWELYKMMKGGQLATSWGFITVGILTFSFGKLAEVGASAGFWEFPNWFPNMVNLIVALMLTLGVFSQRKILS
ncbi:hypothetical protein DRQ29_00880 [bacterium]|nr:MAG: hypothetical protein DRQ29_00880 [bacterium]